MATAIDRLFQMIERNEEVQATLPPQPVRYAMPVGTKRGSYSKNSPWGRKQAARRAKIVRAARALIEQGWVQHEVAIDAEGNAVAPDAPEAAAWCMDGAIMKATYDMGLPGSKESFNNISRVCRVIIDSQEIREGGNPVQRLAQLNDDETTTKDEVLAVLDQAIAALDDRAAGQ